MRDKNDWEKICEDIQKRSLESTPMTVESANKLRGKLFKCLNKANDEGVLKTPLHEINKLLKLSKSEKDGKGFSEIVGGQRNFKRSKDIPHFERWDGCWFDFAILIDQNYQPAEIIGFNFEIRFPENSQINFLRFDLNLPNHNNEERGIRFHFHPGSDDLILHSPPMSPLEILHLFLYSLPIKKRPRSSVR